MVESDVVAIQEKAGIFLNEYLFVPAKPSPRGTSESRPSAGREGDAPSGDAGIGLVVLSFEWFARFGSQSSTRVRFALLAM
jgi:hypothetical protein